MKRVVLGTAGLIIGSCACAFAVLADDGGMPNGLLHLTEWGSGGYGGTPKNSQSGGGGYGGGRGQGGS